MSPDPSDPADGRTDLGGKIGDEAGISRGSMRDHGLKLLPTVYDSCPEWNRIARDENHRLSLGKVEALAGFAFGVEVTG
jgi:hypothetical protein